MSFNSIEKASWAQRGEDSPRSQGCAGNLYSDEMSTAGLCSLHTPPLQLQGCGVSHGLRGRDETCPSQLGLQDARRNPGIWSWAGRTLAQRLLPSLGASLGGGKGRPAFPPLGRVRGPPGRGPLCRPPTCSDTALCHLRSVVLPAAEAADFAQQLHQQHGRVLPSPVSGFGGLLARAVRPAAGAVLVCGRGRDGGVRHPPAGEAGAV